jgi:hypothetical protein
MKSTFCRTAPIEVPDGGPRDDSQIRQELRFGRSRKALKGGAAVLDQAQNGILQQIGFMARIERCCRTGIMRARAHGLSQGASNEGLNLRSKASQKLDPQFGVFLPVCTKSGQAYGIDFRQIHRIRGSGNHDCLDSNHFEFCFKRKTILPVTDDLQGIEKGRFIAFLYSAL